MLQPRSRHLVQIKLGESVMRSVPTRSEASRPLGPAGAIVAASRVQSPDCDPQQF